MTGSEPVRADAAVLQMIINSLETNVDAAITYILLLVPRIARFPHNRLATSAAQSEMRS